MSTAFLLAASMVIGQAEKPASNYDRLKSFDALIGCWSLSGEVLEDVPNVIEKGAKLVGHSSFEWIMKKTAVKNQGFVKFGDLEEVQFLGVIGWNRAKECIVSGSLSSDGAIGQSEITVSEDGKTFTYAEKGVDPDGKSTTVKVVMTLTAPDTIVWQAKDRQGGALVGDSPKYILRRCKDKHENAK